jgi:hypothetical protein
VATDCRSNLYVAEEGNARVQKLGFAGGPPPRCRPAVSVSAAAAQRVSAAGLRATVACDRPCAATVTATITGAGPRALHARALRRAAILRGRPAHVRLVLPRGAAAAGRAGRRVVARVTVTARGLAGPARPVHRAVRVGR